MYPSLPNLLVPDVALSVADLTTHVQDLLEQDSLLQQVWVIGEVSSATRYRSGIFFTLQDPDTRAAISCVVWNNRLAKLAALPEKGEKILVLGRLQVHRERGQYQLSIGQILPAGEGLRALRYRQLRQRLETEGLFAGARKRPLPTHPQTIAVVTSSQAAAWGDIQRTLKRHYPGLRVLLSPASVQGDQAPESIVQAIRRVERDGRAEVMIVARGGGATEDLVCFDDERVVRAIATCKIPIVSGIGHQRDESLADLAADVCAHTPTAAAELVVPRLEELYLVHRGRYEGLHQTVQRRLTQSQRALKHLRRQLSQLHVERLVQQDVQAIAWLQQRLIQGTNQQLQVARQQCQLLRQKLITLDPKAVLQRGYTILRQNNGCIPHSATDLTIGEEVNIQLEQGQVKAKILGIFPDLPSPDSPHKTSVQ